MPKTPKRWTLLQRPNGWLLAHRVNRESVIIEFNRHEPAKLAAEVERALSQQQYTGEGIVLGLDSLSCMVGSVIIDDPRMLRHRQRLVYEFEEGLPVPAEDLTVDFASSKDQAFGVAVETARLAPLLDALQENGIQVQLILPVAFLAASTVAGAKQDQQQWMLWHDEDRVELLVLQDGLPCDWRTLPADPKLLPQHIGMRSLDSASPPRFVFRSATFATRAAIDSLSDLTIEFVDDSPTLVNAAIEAGDRLLRGSSTPWIDLRRDTLASSDPHRPVRGLLNLVTVSAIILLLSVSSVLLFRTHRYEQTAEVYLAAQEDVFRDVLPSRRLPRGIRRILESELAKASGLTGSGTDLPERPSMLVVVRELLSALPQGLRFRINEVRFEQGRISIDGEVRTHADGDALATALRRQGFQVTAPRTQQLPNQGVSIRMTAKYIPPEPAKPKGDSEPTEAAEPKLAAGSNQQPANRRQRSSLVTRYSSFATPK